MARHPVIAFTAAALVAVLTGCGGAESGSAVPAALPTATTTTTSSTSPAETTTPPSSAEETTITDVEETTEEVTTEPEEPDAVIQLGEYAVTLTGEVAGQSFERDAHLYVTGTIAEVGTTNGANEVDACLESGFPAGDPQVGAVWFGSNTGCFPSAGAADIDLAYTSVSGGGGSVEVSIEPDESVAAAGLNTFVESGGLAACLYYAVSGSMELSFDGDGGVSGSIDIGGYSGPCGAVGTESSYSAEFDGYLL